MDTQANSTSQTVTSALTTAENYLQLFAKDTNFQQKMVVAFGNNFNAQNALELKSDWLTGDFSIIPTIEIRDSAEIGGANGAYAGATNTIYMSREFLESSPVEVASGVLLEEMGHAIDWRWGDTDAPGDEGAIFSHLVRGDVLSEEYLQELRVEDDSATVVLDGVERAIERNVPIHPDDYAALKALYESTNGDNWTGNSGWDFSKQTVDATVVNEWWGVTVDTTTGRVTGFDLGGNNLSGSIPPELGNLSSLGWLNLSDNNLSGSIPPELGNLSSVVRLYLSGNNLSGSIPPELGNLSSVIELWLGGNELSGSIPPELGNLSSLGWLDLHGNELSGSIPPELGNLSSVSTLSLSDNNLSGSIAPELGNLGNLQVLWLVGNELSGSIPPELGNLSSLYLLGLEGNELSGPVPESLRHLLPVFPITGDRENNSTYQLKANSAAGSRIQDLGGQDTLELTDVELSLSSPAAGKVGLQRDRTDLAIDINADGKLTADDLRIEDFFQNTRVSQPGAGFIETVDNLSGTDIIASSGEVRKGRGKNDFFKGSDRGDFLLGRGGHDRLVGRDGNDTLIGGNGNDRLKGDVGNDILTGGRGGDRFIFYSKTEFDEANLGTDIITDFNPRKDRILLNKTVFASLESQKGRGFSIIAEFGTVDSDEAAATSDAYIVYNSNNGNLFYNANGNQPDFGTGGQFAILEGAPELDAKNFIIQS